MPCGCDCWAALTLAHGLPAGNASIKIHPQTHTNATMSQLLALVRAGILLRRVSVAPFPLAPSVETYNRLAEKPARNYEPACMFATWMVLLEVS